MPKTETTTKLPKTAAQEPELTNEAGVRQILGGVSRGAVRNAIKAGLPFTKIGRRVLFPIRPARAWARGEDPKASKTEAA